MELYGDKAALRNSILNLKGIKESPDLFQEIFSKRGSQIREKNFA
jgi:hypothetical protein